MNPRTVEIWVGVFVAAGLAALFMLAMRVSNLSAGLESGGYTVTAKFQNASGLKVRSAVTMAGVTIGRVNQIAFDPKSFEAVVVMNIDKRYDNLPEDTSASILTAGLLGEKYVGLEPGGSDQPLKEGSRIELTQSSLVLENLIGQFLFNKAQEGGSTK
ncbi:MAG TPA: outer membrane lipid asymmetry maintenance protein MlaD [Geothrix sp.]|nr:outer membrane lipid asymmetry maintenance protein MlaD [Geothrix sp.]